MASEGEFPKVDGDILYGSEANYQAGNFIQVKAGEDIDAGEWFYVKESDGLAYLADKDLGLVNGVCIVNVTNGNTGNFQTSGKYTTSGLTADTVYYLGDDGALTSTDTGMKLGVATSTTVLYIFSNTTSNLIIKNINITPTADTSESQSPTVTGTIAEMLDYDNTTYYQVSGAKELGIDDAIADVVFDFGKQVYDARIYLDYYLAYSPGGGGDEAYVKYSEDDITYVTLSATTATDHTIITYNIPKFRYLKFRADSSSTSGGASAVAKIYLMNVVGR